MDKVIGTILVFASLTSFAQYGTIDGTVVYKPNSSALPGATVVVFGTRIGTISDVNGYFSIDSLEAGSYDLVIQHIGLGQDMIRSIAVSDNSKTTVTLRLPPGDCSESKSKNCPIDGSAVEVIPIVYGLPSAKTMRKAEKGKVWLGGCIVTGCDPQWYCQRHKHEY